MKKILPVICLVGCLYQSCSNQSKDDNMNPFLKPYDTPFAVPPFDKITNNDYIPAFEEGMRQQLDEVNAIISSKKKPTFDNVIVALDRSGQLLRNVRMVFSGINSAETSDEMQAIDKEINPKLSQHNDDIFLNMDLFARVKAVYEQ
ncbi:MAG: peptidase M3, partial [Bacteroidales bacterium]|nr:peptidase M3 [Bacteroidales bacterium]